MIEKLRELIETKKYSRADIARALMVKGRQISRWLSGTPPHPKNLKMIQELIEGKRMIAPKALVKKRRKMRSRKPEFRYWQSLNIPKVSLK